MPKKKDWLEIMEEAAKPKKGTKLPKGTDFYSITLMMSPQSSMQPWNTGAGADGVVQPEKPVMLDKSTTPPSVYHEGENVYPFPGGKKIVPAKTEEEQFDLEQKQKKMGYPGYQTGGTVYNDPNDIYQQTNTRPTNVYDLNPQVNTYQSGVDQAFETTKQRASGTDPLMENIRNRTLEDYDTRAAVSDTATRQTLVSNPYLTEGAKNAVIAKQRATYNAGLSGLVGDLSRESMSRAEEANRELYDMGRTGVQDELEKQRFEKTFGEQQYVGDLSQSNWEKEFERSGEQWNKAFEFEVEKYGDQMFSRMADDAQTTSLETWLQKYPNATRADYTVAREYKALQLQGMGTANKISQENYDQLVKSGLLTTAQQFLTAEDYEGYAKFMKENLGLDISMDQAIKDRAYHNTITGQQITSNDIMNEAAQLGVNSDRLAVAINAINNGVPLEQVNAQTGLNLTWYDLQSIGRDYINKGIMDQITLDSARTTYGDQKFESIMDRINSGATLDMINKEFPEMKLSVDEFQGLRKTTDLGLREWENNLSAANMLLQTMDADNIMEAQGVLEDLFPGVDFDMRSVVEEADAQKFGEALTELAALSSTFSSYDEAREAINGLRLTDRMPGIGNTQIKELFEAMQFNALDEEWGTIKKSEFFQSLEPDSQQQIKDFLIKGLTGELEFDSVPSYEVVDSNGDLVQAFDNVVDANKLIGENADKGYSLEKRTNMIYKNLLSGDTVTVNNAGDVVSMSNSGQGTATATFDFDDPWNEKNKAVLNDPSNKDFEPALDSLVENVIESGRYSRLRNVVQENDNLKKFLLDNSTPVGNYKGSNGYLYNLEEGQLVKLSYRDPDTNETLGYYVDLITGIRIDDKGNNRYSGYSVYAVDKEGKELKLN